MGISILAFDVIDVFGKVPQNGILDSYKDTVEQQNDIKYSDLGDNALLDLHYRKDYDKSQKHPVCIHIHGGGFVAGGKKYRRRYPNFLAQMGFFVVNADYDLCPTKKFHEYIPEFIDLLQWVKEHAAEYNYDPMRILVTGDSSGGHCSSVLADLVTNPEYAKQLGVKVPSGVMVSDAALMCGCYDIESLFSARRYPLNSNIEMAELITGLDLKGKKFKDMGEMKNYQYYDQLFTINYVTPDFPTTFLCHVENDMFCLGQGDLMKEKLEQQKVPFKEYKANRLGDIHCFHLFKRKSAYECLASLNKFLVAEYHDLGVKQLDRKI